MSSYCVPASEGSSEYVEKRSSFLGRVRRIETEEEAREFIFSVKKEHRDARHNCWCYIVRNGAERYSDDGEPQGTAGIPMLEVFRKSGVTNVVCVVTRYFGGILLGAGGLLRAYTKAAKDALEDAGTEEIIPRVQYRIPCSYALLDRIRMEIPAFSGKEEEADYGACVTLTVTVPAEIADSFAARMYDLSNGTVIAEKLLTNYENHL